MTDRTPTQPPQPKPEPAGQAEPYRQQSPEPNRPADTLRDGSLKATIWKRQGESGDYYATDLARTYTDREGNLRDSRSFGSNDLLRVSELAKSAYHRTNELRREQAQARKADAERGEGEEGRDERRESHRRSRRPRSRGTRRPEQSR
jgi:multidrug resistance efflux pump